MKTLHVRKSIGGTLLRLALIALMFACSALSPMALAVSPPPDGGYPGANTAEGTNALFSLTSGVWNTALGFQALYHDTTGNTNAATGVRALFSNTTGNQNSANGVQALYSNTHGGNNTAAGYQALFSNTIGLQNTATGAYSLYFNTATNNTAIGFAALYLNTTGASNVAVGHAALRSNTTGENNTAIGGTALVNATGSNNTAVGRDAGAAVTNASNVIAIGAGLFAENVSNTCYIGNIFGVTSAGATAVYVNSAGKLGTVVSSWRFKEEVKPMDKASEAILALKPVTFRYKQEIDPARGPQFGLVAEDVEKVNPDLVVRDRDGKVNTVRYEAINAMLLNEFIKEHSKVEQQEIAITELRSNAAKQEATISELKKDLGVLTTQLKEQAAQVQMVNAQIELKAQAPLVVSNSP